MQNGKTVLFGAVIAIVAGLFGANVAQMHDDSQKPLTNSLAAGGAIFGHVTVIEKDSHGHDIAYRQTDNLIINQGLNCMAVALFRTNTLASDSASDVDNCGGTFATATATGTQYFNTASAVGGFRWIQIGGIQTDTGTTTDATTPVTGSQNALFAPFTAATTAQTADTIGVVTFTPQGTNTGATGTYPVVTIQANGLTVGGTAATVAEAGLFDNGYTGSGTTWPNMFARQTFATITMSASDTLSVTWTITLAP